MAGCFGNHPIDRWMEHQLHQHLAEFDEDNECAFCGNPCEKTFCSDECRKAEYHENCVD